jgi:methylenetetrahydrofolate dehydrogenase (NADP+) / methenyltetrahydrofolate cyclohydrolase
MPVQIIDGKALALKIREEIALKVTQLKKDTGVIPGLAVVLVGDNPASQVYVRNKEKACAKAGLFSEQFNLAAATTQADLLQLIDKLNADPKFHGILVQLPLPDGIDENVILQAVDPVKDVDGFHPLNQGKLLAGLPAPRPCTPFGIMKMLESINYDLSGKEAVVVGRSQIVGKPIALMLLEKHATVTVCHSRTNDLAAEVKKADVVIAAVGRPKMVKGDWIKPGAVAIDVGINRLDDGSLCGDIDFEGAMENASFITPVPGGVGPMTIAMLLWNTLEAAKQP